MTTEIVYAGAMHIDDVACRCAVCTGLRDEYGDSLEASLDPQAGGTANDKPIWTAEQAASYLNRTGTSWATTGIQRGDADPNTITFGFFDTQDQVASNGYTYELGGTYYGLNEYFGFAAFSDAQRAATREAIQYWDDLISVTFVETGADSADVNFGNLTNRPGTQAYARLPYDSVSSNAHVNAQAYDIVGDVWVTGTTTSNFGLDEGMYGLTTLVHEFGHSLGLSHPGQYNFAPGFTVNYANGAEYAQDARNYSIMSYWNPRDMGTTSTGVPTRDFDWSIMSVAYGATPMVHDILAAQMMYGADLTTRTGDTTYGFNSNAGRDAFDFDKTPWPTMAIYDAGGNDTLDASGYEITQVIDLTPGSLSSIGGITYEEALATITLESVNANRALAGYSPITQETFDSNMASFASEPDWRGRLTDNVGIAYGTVVENAKGGSGKDTIIGNAADNRLYGNAGDDLLSGQGGRDKLFGGDGSDRLNGGDGIDAFAGGAGDDIFLAQINTDKILTKRGSLSLDFILDFDGNGDDLIDLSGIGRSMAFQGDSSGRSEGALTFKSYTSVTGAEKALGVSFQGFLGEVAPTGPVAILFGNTDSDTDQEFAFVLFNTQSVDAGDFIFANSASAGLEESLQQNLMFA